MIGTKYIPITREEVQRAFKRVKSNGGSAGIDEQSINDYEAKLDDNLYKLWNRLASGSYFPPSVKEVEIPKKDGKMRKLGIPTVGDRIAQTVIKERIEPIFEKEFHTQSYGYRPGKSCHQAIAEARKNCWQYDWVVDLDIKGFFDNIDHNLLMLAIDRHITEKWVKMYLKRWLEMPTEMKNGEIKYRDGKGTPQGGVVSPLLANLFLHYVFDKWLMINYPTIKFERYADDIIVHCATLEQAEMLLESIRKRMSECKLELHPDKTKIVYCKDKNRKGNYKNISFNFLGYTFQPRESKSKGEIFLGFDCAISRSNRVKIVEKIRDMKIHRRTVSTIEEIAQVLNPKIQGWINYYGKFKKHAMRGVFYCLNERLVVWTKNRYKSLNWNESYVQIREEIKKRPKLFAHWKAGFIGV